MTTTPQPPDHVIHWRRSLQSQAPRCCWTCDHFDPAVNFWCAPFKSAVPRDYADSINSCQHYEDEVPF
jgi:hypothetical protein